MEVVRPTNAGPSPAVVLLHGRGGLSLYGTEFKERAALLADRGFVVFTPHYFDASDSKDSPEVTQQLFETWRESLRDALLFVSSRPEVDRKRIGVVGVSLGGFLASAEAAQDDLIAALVSESSGVSTWFPSSPRRMPPLLIVHSREDNTVPLSDAQHLAEIAQRFGVQPEYALYDGQRHVLKGPAAISANLREADFLSRTLGARA